MAISLYGDIKIYDSIYILVIYNWIWKKKIAHNYHIQYNEKYSTVIISLLFRARSVEISSRNWCFNHKVELRNPDGTNTRINMHKPGHGWQIYESRFIWRKRKGKSKVGLLTNVFRRGRSRNSLRIMTMLNPTNRVRLSPMAPSGRHKYHLDSPNW